MEEARLARILGGAGLAPGETPTAAFALLDRKLGVLGDAQASLRGLLFQPRSAPGVHFESYLWMRAPGKGLAGGSSWLRRWFVLEGSRLFFVRESGGDPGEAWKEEEGEDGGPQRTLICDVLLSSVREVTTAPAGGGGGGGGVGGGSAATSAASAASAMAAAVASAATASAGGMDPGLLPFCFEVFSANRKSVLLQAETREDFAKWTATIRKRIERLLIGEDGGAQQPQSLLGGHSSPPGARSASPSPPPSPTSTYCLLFPHVLKNNILRPDHLSTTLCLQDSPAKPQRVAAAAASTQPPAAAATASARPARLPGCGTRSSRPSWRPTPPAPTAAPPSRTGAP